MHHQAKISYRRKPDELFIDNKYSRKHTWHFDGGTTIAASSSPLIVPVPFSDAAAVDPEEAFVAAIASCHMLFFLFICAKRKLTVNSYEDAASGSVNTKSDSKKHISDIYLTPIVHFADGETPDAATLKLLHEQAHTQCFLANSVNSLIHIMPVLN